MRSPEAVLDPRAYQEACPHPGPAFACEEAKRAIAAKEAAANVERRIVVKSVVPVRWSLHGACKRSKQGEKWRKSGIYHHAMLRDVTFVIQMLAIFLRSQLRVIGRKPYESGTNRNLIPHRQEEEDLHECSRKNF
jgi:hypothetical protein